jgi:hypothetical protein
MRVQPAIERVAFQINSPLAKGMIKLTNEFITWVEATRKDYLVDGKIVAVTQKRMDETADYANKIFTPGLIKLVKQQLGFTVKVESIRVLTHADGAMVPIFADILKTEDWDRVLLGEALFSGTAPPNSKEFDPTVFTKLSETIDLTKSKLTEKTDQYFIILFTYPYSFLGEEIYVGVPALTAEEQSAIILHELGHGMTILEHMGELYHRAELATNSVKYLSETADVKTAETVLTELNELPASMAKPPEMVAALTVIKEQKVKPKGFVELIAVLGFFVALMALVTMCMRFFDAGRYGAINAQTRKTSDTVITASNQSYMERIADEFVSRHGLGRPLVSALQKIFGDSGAGHYRRSPLGEAIFENLLVKSTLFSIGLVTHFFGMMFFYYDDGTYDPPLLRLEHILLNNMVAFKDVGLSAQTEAYFLKETKAMLAMVDSYKKSKSYRFRQLFWGTIMRILTRSSIVDGFNTANLSNDYDRLQLMTNELVKNRLFYHAARLKQL